MVCRFTEEWNTNSNIVIWVSINKETMGRLSFPKLRLTLVYLGHAMLIEVYLGHAMLIEVYLGHAMLIDWFTLGMQC